MKLGPHLRLAEVRASSAIFHCLHLPASEFSSIPTTLPPSIPSNQLYKNIASWTKIELLEVRRPSYSIWCYMFDRSATRPSPLLCALGHVGHLHTRPQPQAQRNFKLKTHRPPIILPTKDCSYKGEHPNQEAPEPANMSSHRTPNGLTTRKLPEGPKLS